MPKSNLQLLVHKTRRDLWKDHRAKWSLLLIFLFALLSLGTRYIEYAETFANVEKLRNETRENWENRPDKHPHRMAHYGYLVFRNSHPLQIFDGGLDHFLGNVIFLEAHKQNTANLSEASKSGTLVRFGTFSSAFILQALVPLLLLFLGYGLIAKEREDATLKLLNIQGLSRRKILWGKILGIWQFSLYYLLPLFPIIFVAIITLGNVSWIDVLLRLSVILLSYALFYFFICSLIVIISSASKTATTALVSLIGCWLLLVLIVPKTVQFIAKNAYPTPSRIALETKVEEEVLNVGDSHNPDDPHFNHIKDSLLNNYKVTSIEDLPINYGGIVMKEGERISSEIYSDHLNELQAQYDHQQKLSELSGIINPLAAIKNFSMAVSGTDYYSYQKFQQQAENYRYRLAQHMNNLQIEHISNTKPKAGESPAVVHQEYWKNFPDFDYQFTPLKSSLLQQSIPMAILLFWLVLSVLLVEISAKKLKFI